MKKKLAILLAVLMLVSVLGGCAASYGKAADTQAYDDYYPSNAKTESGYYAYDEAMPEEAEYYEADYDDVELETDEISGVTATSTVINADKIIYTASAEIETVKFDESLDQLYAMIKSLGGFIESSSVSGNDYATDYYGYQSYRYARFTIRVPKEVFEGTCDSLGQLGNVTMLTQQSTNITSQYTDVESRLKAYRTEEAALLAMMEKAETVDIMLQIESQLSEVRYRIENLTSQLRNMQGSVDYSTVSIYLREVKELSEQVPVQQSYWEKIGTGFVRSLKNVGEFFKDLFQWLIISLPVLVLLAAIGFGLFFLIRFWSRKSKAKKAKKAAQAANQIINK